MKLCLPISKIIFACLILFAGCDKKVTVSGPDAPAPQGKLVLNSNPVGAKIFVNGLNTAKYTPDSILSLEPGSYDVMLKLYPFANLSETIVVDSIEPTPLFINFETADENLCNIEVLTEPPGAEILLNDEPTGLFTPDTITSLWFDVYKIKCTYPEHRSDSTTISLTGGQFKSLNFVLQDTSKYVDYNPHNSNFPAYHVECVVVDNQNIVWAGCSPGGIVKYEKGIFTYYSPANTPYFASMVHYIAVDDQNTKWFGTNRGLISLDNSGNWNIYSTENSDIPTDEVYAIDIDRYSNIWLGVGNSTTRKYLVKFNGADWSSWSTPLQSYVRAIEVDQDGLVWVGLGLSFYLFYEGNWIKPAIDFEETPNLRTRGVVSIKETFDGKILIGCGSRQRQGVGGLYYSLDAELHKYTGYQLHEKDVSNIYIAANGNIWISTLGQYPFIIPDENTPILIKINPQWNVEYYTIVNTPLSSGYIMQAAAQENGDLWLASRDKGIIKFKNANHN